MKGTVQEAIKTQDLYLVKKLLEENPKAVEARDENGAPVSFLAALEGDLPLLKYLVEYSVASFHERDDRGRQALHYGVRSGSLSVVIYLTERVGLSCLEGDYGLETPFDLAERLGYREIAAYFETRCGCTLDQMYRNPILTGMHPDPSVVRVGGDYYMVHSSFVYFPCIPVSHSRDLIHWEGIGYAITRSDWAALDGLEGGRGYWAPDISWYEGRFYITATYRMNDTGNVRRMQMVTSSEKPEGPYEKPVFLEEDGIDPSLFTDTDGRRYMLLNRGARIFEISRDGKKILSRPRLLWYGDQKRAPEGPHLIRRDGYYYLFLAEGGTGRGHRISVARSQSLFGPYESCPYNPIMRQWDETAAIQYCGHGKPVEASDGRWYMVYLCSRLIDGKYGMLGRETCLDPITWTADGWPIVNRLRGPSVLQKKPETAETFHGGQSPEAGKHLLSFPSEDAWGIWRTVRRSLPGDFGTEDGVFWLKGDGRDLSDMACRSLLLIHQPAFTFRFGCTIHGERLKEGDEAGITCYYDENSFIAFGLVRNREGYSITAKEYVGDGYRSRHVFETGVEGAVELEVRTDRLKRSLSFKHDGGPVVVTLELEDTSYLSSEGLTKGKRFTGASAGIYVTGQGKGWFEALLTEV